jgi:hypothetical protein
MGWLGDKNITVVRKRGHFKIAAINDDSSAGIPRAAVFPDIDLWLEWRSGMDTAEAGGMLLNNRGFFLRRGNKLLDFDLQGCDQMDQSEWEESVERDSVTLMPGRTLVLRKQGLLIQPDGSGPSDGLFGFNVHFTGEVQTCEPALPRIATGLFGEYSNCGVEDGCAKPAAFAKTSGHTLENIANQDSDECEISSFTVSLGSDLAVGWAFEAGPSVEIQPGHDRKTTFGFGFPDNAVDGDYDHCIVATNTATGLKSGKIHRITLPFSYTDTPWYINNRVPNDVNPTLAEACDGISGCDTGVNENCVWEPQSSCSLNLACDDGDTLSNFGRCWKEEGSDTGARFRGRDNCAILQSFCIGGPSILEKGACENPLKELCYNQATCMADPSIWNELLVAGGSGFCTGDDLCGSGKIGENAAVCDECYTSGDMKPGSHPCFLGSTVNITCARELCEGADTCGGYHMTFPETTSLKLKAGSIANPSYANPNYQCFKKPTSDSVECTCLEGEALVLVAGCSGR